MKDRIPDSPPPVAASASAVSAESPVHEKSAHASVDADSALITPTKAASDGRQQEPSTRVRKRPHTQLLLAVEKDGAASTSRVVLKNNNKKKKSFSSSAKAAPTASSGGRDIIRSSQPSMKWPPVSSAKSLPPLTGRISDLLKAEQRSSKKKAMPRDTIEFDVNQECTSIGLVPSGRIAVAGFTDGTLRLFDLTGTFIKDRNDPSNQNASKDLCDLFDDDASSSEDSFCSTDTSPAKNAKSVSVNSHANQRYGAVACQIHARGVHTSLLMDVAVSEDGLYAFGGVQRGSVELAAVYLGDVESHLDELQEMDNKKDKKKKAVETETLGLLDLIQVDRHADAKLKGFGACARLWNGWERATKSGERPEYLLFTGKGIKNIHIWSYKPSRLEKDEDSVWTCLYDTPSNGNTINQLYFRHNALGTLQGISKSDGQKIRVWDLTYEQRRIAKGGKGSDRPKRPDYVDVASTEETIGVCGPYAFASDSLGGMHNIINVVSLDTDRPSSPFNCTELALPSPDSGGEQSASGGQRATRSSRQQRGETEHSFGTAARSSRTGRQQRGDLKNVVHVAGLVFDASHALLHLSDGSMVQYQHNRTGHPSLLQSPASLCATRIDEDDSSAPGSTNNHNKRISLARVGSQGMALLAVSSFNENTLRGAIMLRALPGSVIIASDVKSVSRSRRYWGFNGLKKRRDKQSSAAVVGTAKTIGQNDYSSGSPVAVVPINGSPVTAAKNIKKISPVSPIEANTTLDKSNRPGKKRTPEEDTRFEQMDCTPVPPNKSHTKNMSLMQVSPLGLSLTLPELNTEPKKPSYSSKKRISEEVQNLAQIYSRLPVESAQGLVTKVKKHFPTQSGHPTKAIDSGGRPGNKRLPEDSSGFQKLTASKRIESASMPAATKSKKQSQTVSEPMAQANESSGSRRKHSPEEQVVRQLKSTPVPSAKIKKNALSPFKPNIESDKSTTPSIRHSSKKTPGLEPEMDMLEPKLSPFFKSTRKNPTPFEPNIKSDKLSGPSTKHSSNEILGLEQNAVTLLESKLTPAIESKKKTHSPLEPSNKSDMPNGSNQNRSSAVVSGLEQNAVTLLKSKPIPVTKSKKKTHSPLEPKLKSDKSSGTSKNFSSEVTPGLEQKMVTLLESKPVPVVKSRKKIPSPLEPSIKSDKFSGPSKNFSSEATKGLEQKTNMLESKPVPVIKSKKNAPSPLELSIKSNKFSGPSKNFSSEVLGSEPKMDMPESTGIPAIEAKKPFNSFQFNIKPDKFNRDIEQRLPKEIPRLNLKMNTQPAFTPGPAIKIKKVTPGCVSQTSLEPIIKANRSIRPTTKSLVQVESTPVPQNKSSRKAISVNKVTPGDLSLTPTSEPKTETKKSSGPSKSKKQPPEKEQMDSQLESIVRGYNLKPIYSPKRPNTVDEKLSLNNSDPPTKKQKIVQDKRHEVDPQPAHVKSTPPSSPKKRGRKKSPLKSTFKSYPAKDSATELVTDHESNNTHVGFLGMTIVHNKKSEKILPESCFQPRTRPPLLVEQLPNGTISSQLVDVPTAVPSPFSSMKATQTTTTTTESVHLQRHSNERQTLAAKHRAEHDMVRKKVLHSIRFVLSTWDVELDSNRPHGSIVDSAKRWFDDALMGHQELLSDMIDRQNLDAESLAARQSAELLNTCAPMLQVSFPFPEVFEQARQEMLSLLH